MSPFPRTAPSPKSSASTHAATTATTATAAITAAAAATVAAAETADTAATAAGIHRRSAAVAEATAATTTAKAIAAASAFAGPLPLVYRPDIDGLRAVAVLAVVFYHARLSCPGGYVGVDVFFVISGYLITALLWRELREGSLSLAGFWERRVRRIFPASAVMVLATLLAGAFLPLAADYAKLGWSALAQSVMSANLFFWRQEGGYFADTGFHPLMHTWSLAVEEQFYLFFPLALLFFRSWFRERPAMLRRWLWIGFWGSLALAAIFLPWKTRSVFFLLPTRAWELLCGALLAMFPAAWFVSHRRWRWLREAATWAGLAGILAPVWLYSDRTLFPGLAALPPCLGAAAIIWANTRVNVRNDAIAEGGEEGAGLTLFGRVLAWRPVVFVGLISYSLYLWHWPVLAFAHYGYPSNNLPGLSVSTRLLPLALAAALAVVSWRWIEVPFRKKRIAKSRRTVFGLAAAVTALVMAAGGSIALSRGFPSRMATEVARLNAAALDDTGFRDNVEIADVVAGRLPRLGNVDPDAPVRVLLWGDSHAMHVAAALDVFCRSQGVAGEIVACHSTPPVLDTVLEKRSHLGKDATVWADAVFQHIRKTGVRDVLLAARWGGYERNNPRLLETALRETIRHLTAEAGCRVWVLQDTPDVDVVVPKILITEALATSSSWVWGNRGEWRRTEEQHRRKNPVLYRLAEQASLGKIPARFIDPAPALLEPDGHYRADQDGVSLYFDDDHLTTRGSRLVLLPLLEAAMGDAFGK